ncbi:hypothetical protein ACFYO7_32215 [Nocardia salmonicida]|uniref:hypothetical protein n=1 Tax=Nocardia salmonicida TaxID=53431 RepID=UPI0036C64D15
MPPTMRAIRLTGPVTPDQLTVTDVPVPDVRPGWVRLQVKAFGVNESELISAKGKSSPDFSFPPHPRHRGRGHHRRRTGRQ